MEKRKSFDGVVKNSAEKKNKISPRFSLAKLSFGEKGFFSGFNLGISFVFFAILLLGFWYTFRAVALNAPTGNPPTGTGNVISVNASGTIVLIGGGTGKLNVGTIDPVFDISGIKYATYVSGMVGQREEISGVLKFPNSKYPISNSQCLEIGNWKLEIGGTAYSCVIDFNKQEIGSDLWLFRKITDFSANGGKQDWSGLSVLLTPEFSGRVWYEKRPAENQLVIYAIPTINYSVTELPSYEVSFRLSAPRFDWRQWPNLLEDQSLSGFKVE